MVRPDSMLREWKQDEEKCCYGEQLNTFKIKLKCGKVNVKGAASWAQKGHWGEETDLAEVEQKRSTHSRLDAEGGEAGDKRDRASTTRHLHFQKENSVEEGDACEISVIKRNNSNANIYMKASLLPSRTRWRIRITHTRRSLYFLCIWGPYVTITEHCNEKRHPFSLPKYSKFRMVLGEKLEFFVNESRIINKSNEQILRLN